MLYFFRVLIILLKGIIPCFASVFSMVWLVSAVSFRSFRPFRLFRWFRFARFGGFVSLFLVLVHAQFCKRNHFALGEQNHRCRETGLERAIWLLVHAWRLVGFVLVCEKEVAHCSVFKLRELHVSV